MMVVTCPTCERKYTDIIDHNVGHDFVVVCDDCLTQLQCVPVKRWFGLGTKIKIKVRPNVES